MKGLKKLLTTVIMILWTAGAAYAQQPIAVSGHVTDNTGEPFIGVSILEKGTSNGVITDINGEYRINVKSGAVLVFSYIGFTTQEIKVTGPTLNVTLKEDTQIIDEVVVIGYGVQKKSNVTGSISSVKADDMKKIQSLMLLPQCKEKSPACRSLTTQVHRALLRPSVSEAIARMAPATRFTSLTVLRWTTYPILTQAASRAWRF